MNDKKKKTGKKEANETTKDMTELSKEFLKNPEAVIRNWKVAVHKPQWDIWFVPYTESETGIFGFMPFDPGPEMLNKAIEFLRDQYQAINQRYDITFDGDIPPPVEKDVQLKGMRTVLNLMRKRMRQRR